MRSLLFSLFVALAPMAVAECVATATTENAALKKDFETRVCEEEGLLRANLIEQGDMLEVELVTDIEREQATFSPFKTVAAANMAQKVYAYVERTFDLHPETFQWTVFARDGHYLCTARIDRLGDDKLAVSGDCGGLAGAPAPIEPPTKEATPTVGTIV